MARPKRFPERLNVPLAEGVLERVAAVLDDQEKAADLARAAIDREIKRRTTNIDAAAPKGLEMART